MVVNPYNNNSAQMSFFTLSECATISVLNKFGLAGVRKFFCQIAPDHEVLALSKIANLVQEYVGGPEDDGHKPIFRQIGSIVSQYTPENIDFEDAFDPSWFMKLLDSRQVRATPKRSISQIMPKIIREQLFGDITKGALFRYVIDHQVDPTNNRMGWGVLKCTYYYLKNTSDGSVESEPTPTSLLNHFDRARNWCETNWVSFLYAAVKNKNLELAQTFLSNEISAQCRKNLILCAAGIVFIAHLGWHDRKVRDKPMLRLLLSTPLPENIIANIASYFPESQNDFHDEEGIFSENRFLSWLISDD